MDLILRNMGNRYKNILILLVSLSYKTFALGMAYFFHKCPGPAFHKSKSLTTNKYSTKRLLPKRLGLRKDRIVCKKTQG